jgi:hypothetical protein
MVVELESFDVASDVGADGYRWARARLRVSRDGQGLSGWGLENLEIEDPTGNRVTYDLRRPGRTVLPMRSNISAAGRVELEFPWPGWAEEPVWEMTLRWCPVEFSALAVGDPAAVLRSIHPPSVEGVTWVDQAVSLSGLQFKILGLAGAHASIQDRAHDVFGQTIVELEVPQLPQGRRLGVMAAGDQGTALGLGQPIGEVGESVGFEVPDTVQALDLAIVLYPERQVSFRVSE